MKIILFRFIDRRRLVNASSNSRSGDVRGGEPAGLAAEEARGVLAFLVPKREREEDAGCSSEVGLLEAGERWGEGDLRLAKEVERKREGRRDGMGACMWMGGGRREGMSKGPG